MMATAWLRRLYTHRQSGPVHWGLKGISRVERAAYRSGWLKPASQRLPQFLVIGATKAGTSWLYRNLQPHPALFLPTTKELHYFDRHFDEPLFMYTRHFRGGESKLRGEVTPAYSVLPPERIQFIRWLMPDARIVFIMRNPIDRIWSNAVYDLTRKGDKRTADALSRDELLSILDHENLIARSDYPRILQNWSSVYPESQIQLLFYDQIRQDPRGLLCAVFAHLGVTQEVDWSRFPISERFNAGPSSTMPPDIRRMLETRYCPMIEQLYARFGDSVADWRCPRPDNEA